MEDLEKVHAQEIYNFLINNPRHQVYLKELIDFKLRNPESKVCGEMFEYLIEHVKNVLQWPRLQELK